MPAPAVIPALRAYINAVAVKGFVVELRADQQAPRPTLWVWAKLWQFVNIIGNTFMGTFLPIFACNVCREAPVYFTVTKKARLKQSFRL